MIETLKHIDSWLFSAVNTGAQNAFFDFVCPYLRMPGLWTPLYIALFYVSVVHYRKRTIWLVGMAVLLILLSDQLSANLIKNLVQRPRPCREPSLEGQVRLLVHCGGGFSFISAHATNHFAIAVFFSTLFTARYRWIFAVALFWAASICFAQVYVGVHYPFDVICGAMLGSLMGYCAARIIQPKLVHDP